MLKRSWIISLNGKIVMGRFTTKQFSLLEFWLVRTNQQAFSRAMDKRVLTEEYYFEEYYYITEELLYNRSITI